MFNVTKLRTKAKQTNQISEQANNAGAPNFGYATHCASEIYEQMIDYAEVVMSTATLHTTKEEARTELKDLVERRRTEMADYTEAESAELFHAIAAADDVLRYSVKTIYFRYDD